MTERSALGELARFVGTSALISTNQAEHRRAVNAMSNALPARSRRSVGELLGAVLALSARTRRVVMAPTTCTVDVYLPDGRRAVDLTFGR